MMLVRNIATERNERNHVMKKFAQVILAAAIACSSLTAATHAAHAKKCSPGFIANLACKTGIISKKKANTLDQIHRRIGKPLDRAGRVILHRVIR